MMVKSFMSCWFDFVGDCRVRRKEKEGKGAPPFLPTLPLGVLIPPSCPPTRSLAHLHSTEAVCTAPLSLFTCYC